MIQYFKMLLLYFVMFGLLGTSRGADILREEIEREVTSPEDSLVSCVVQILNRYYTSAGLLTVVDMSSEDKRLLQAVHSLALLSVVYRKPTAKCHVYNRAYLLTADNVTDFTQNFQHLIWEPTWNPHAKFIIVVKRIVEDELREVFNVLLHFHVLNVLVVNGTDPFLYTYNPYEDYACGKYYNRIINFGRCPASVDLYPNKLTTGLRRCTVTITVPHWPPYTVNPAKIKRGMLPIGVEQLVMNIIGQKEQFNITYIYKHRNEEYSNVSNTMKATGPLRLLQKNKTDMMMGGLLLSATRAAAFDYTCAHLALAEDMKILVRIASFKPVWKSFYLEFDMSVWLLLLLCLITFATLMLMLLETRDVGDIYLKLIDSLLLHGCKIRAKWTVKCVFIFWVWFAYLLNCFYQSSLMSLTTKPSKEIEYTQVAHIGQYQLKFCLSPMMAKLIMLERNYTKLPYKTVKDGCDSFLGSVKTVSEKDNMFTVVLYSVVLYHKYDFADNFGSPRVRGLRSTVHKVSYAIFMYKGFPMTRRLNMLALRLRESGLVQNFMNYQHHIMGTEHRYKQKRFEARFVIPWYLYIFGHLLSTIVFFAEHLSKYKASRRSELKARRH